VNRLATDVENGAQNHHLDVIEALKEPIAVSAIVMIVDFMLVAIILFVEHVVARSALKSLIIVVALVIPMTFCVHVLITRFLAAKVPIAAIAFPSRGAMAGGAAVVLPGLESGREYLVTSSAFEHFEDFRLRVRRNSDVGDAFLTRGVGRRVEGTERWESNLKFERSLIREVNRGNHRSPLS